MKRISNLKVLLVFPLLLIFFGILSDAFVSSPHLYNHNSQVTSSPSLLLAGFGGGATSKKKKNNKKTSKLKPRQQWGRFNDLKDADIVRVAAQKGDKWFAIGEIKSENNQYTEAAVVRHRLLLTDHARRMFPVQILANDKLVWGYSMTSSEEEGDDWTVVSSAPSNNLPDDIDKRIGFRGLPDPTGFYANSGTGLKAGESLVFSSTEQAGYLNMKSKAITGHTGHEIHD